MRGTLFVDLVEKVEGDFRCFSLDTSRENPNFIPLVPSALALPLRTFELPTLPKSTSFGGVI